MSTTSIKTTENSICTLRHVEILQRALSLVNPPPPIHPVPHPNGPKITSGAARSSGATRSSGTAKSSETEQETTRRRRSSRGRSGGLSLRRRLAALDELTRELEGLVVLQVGCVCVYVCVCVCACVCLCVRVCVCVCVCGGWVLV